MENINNIMEFKFDNFAKGVVDSNSHVIDTDEMIQQQSIMGWNDFQPYYPYIKEYYPVYLGWQNENKTEKAFNIVNILISKKFIKLDKVKDFVRLVNDIAKEI